MILKPKRASRGLPDHSLLGDEAKFIAPFEACVKDATLYLGADKVRQIVKKVTKKPRGKQEALNRTALNAYRAEAAKGEVNISKLAERLSPGEGREAMRARLYRLRREQDRRAREYADLAERLRYGSSTLLRSKKISRYRGGTLLGSDI